MQCVGHDGRMSRDHLSRVLLLWTSVCAVRARSAASEEKGETRRVGLLGSNELLPVTSCCRFSAVSVFPAGRGTDKPKVLHRSLDGLQVFLGGRCGEARFRGPVHANLPLPVSYSRHSCAECERRQKPARGPRLLCPEQNREQQQQLSAPGRRRRRRQEADPLPPEPNPGVCPDVHPGSPGGETALQPQPPRRPAV